MLILAQGPSIEQHLINYHTVASPSSYLSPSSSAYTSVPLAATGHTGIFEASLLDRIQLLLPLSLGPVASLPSFLLPSAYYIFFRYYQRFLFQKGALDSP